MDAGGDSVLEGITLPRWSRLGLLVTVVASVLAVLVAATVQMSVVMGSNLTPGAYVVPIIVGSVFGLGIAAHRRLLAINRIYSSALEERQRAVEALNEDLERRVEARTRELAEKQAQLMRGQQLQAVATLSGGVVHDLKNLLQIIHSTAALSQGTSPVEQDEAFAQILEQARHAGRMTDRVLRVAAHGYEQEWRPVDEVVTPIVDLLRRSLPNTLRLSLVVVDGTGRVPVASTEQILLNLVTNARDALDEDGDIEVHVDTTQHEGRRTAVLTVRDDGPGIPAEAQAHLFDAFVTTKGPEGGTGLGLAVVRTLVQAHDGDVDVESSPAGTTFRVRFPMPRPRPVAAANPDPLRAAS